MLTTYLVIVGSSAELVTCSNESKARARSGLVKQCKYANESVVIRPASQHEIATVNEADRYRKTRGPLMQRIAQFKTRIATMAPLFDGEATTALDQPVLF